MSGKNRKDRHFGERAHVPDFISTGWFVGDTGGLFHEFGKKGGCGFDKSYNDNRHAYYAVPDINYIRLIFMQDMAKTMNLDKAMKGNGKDFDHASQELEKYFSSFQENGVLFMPEYSRSAHHCYGRKEKAISTVHVINGRNAKKESGDVREIFDGYKARTNLVVVDFGCGCMKEFLGKRYNGYGVITLNPSMKAPGRY